MSLRLQSRRMFNAELADLRSRAGSSLPVRTLAIADSVTASVGLPVNATTVIRNFVLRPVVKSGKTVSRKPELEQVRNGTPSEIGADGAPVVSGPRPAGLEQERGGSAVAAARRLLSLDADDDAAIRQRLLRTHDSGYGLPARAADQSVDVVAGNHRSAELPAFALKRRAQSRPAIGTIHRAGER